MHLEKLVIQQQQIGKESCDCISPDFRPKPSLFYPQIHQIQTKTTFSQSNPKNSITTTSTHFTPNERQTKTHLTIQIPLTSPNPTTKTHQFHHENSSPTILSTPHKRPIMTQTAFLSHPPILSSLTNNHHHHYHHKGNKTSLNSDSSSSCCYLLSLLCSTSFAIPFATKQLAHKLFRHVLRARLICFHLRFLILLSLSSLYFFFVFSHRRLLIFFLSILAFSLTLLAFLNLALPRLPSIRLFLARSLPLKLNSCTASSKSCTQQVVWSIGSKPKSEKTVNSGSWVQVYSNGDVYEGEFHRGKCSGSGVFYYYMKGRYEGDWIDGNYDGYGVETWARGSRYRGQYRQGMRHGIGVYRFYTGDLYAGEWSNGQSHGCGVHTCEDGSRYVGEFKWGVKHGLGHYHFRNGDTYAGEYFADKMHGFGVYQFGNGHQYEGAWHEGRRQGFGMYSFRNGDTQSGHWQNGVLDSPGSPNAVGHSKVLNTVQEAQRAAKRAYDVARVEERVNRAVVAANKAANAARVAAVKAVQKQTHHSSSDDMPTPLV